MHVGSASPAFGSHLARSARPLGARGDGRLVRDTCRGDQRAFEALYERYHRGVLSFCRHMLRRREDAEDAVQQTFLTAYREFRAGSKPSNVRAWLYAVARNRCLTILRDRREHPTETIEIAGEGLAAEIDRRADLREMLADIESLPDDQRAALVLFEIGDLPQRQIAGVLQCEPRKVKALVFQARSSLIETRLARDTSCQDVREQLSTLRGAALRRRPLRRHVRSCAGCAEFYAEVRRQRRLVAALLPVVPGEGLKASILGGLGTGSGVAGSGFVVSFLASAGTAKLLGLSIATTGSLVGASAAVDSTVLKEDTPAAGLQVRDTSRPDGAHAPAPSRGGETAVAPAARARHAAASPYRRRSRRAAAAGRAARSGREAPGARGAGALPLAPRVGGGRGRSGLRDSGPRRTGLGRSRQGAPGSRGVGRRGRPVSPVRPRPRQRRGGGPARPERRHPGGAQRHRPAADRRRTERVALPPLPPQGLQDALGRLGGPQGTPHPAPQPRNPREGRE